MRDVPAVRKDQAMIDETHSPARRSWVASANEHADFPIQNLPLGVFAPPGGAPRGGVAIGDEIFDLAVALELGLFDGVAARAAEAARGATLNPLFALGREARVALRRRVGDILDWPGARQGGSAAVAPRSPRRRLPPRASGGDRRLHRLFRRHPPRHHCGQAVPPRQSAATELQICAHRLSRPHLLDRRIGGDAAPPERPAQTVYRNGAELRALPQSRLRARARGLDRTWQRAGHTGCHRRCGKPHRGLLLAERLVRARHPGVGIPAARPLPRQELFDHHLALGRHSRGAGALSDGAGAAAGGRSGASAPSLGRGGPGRGRPRHRARGVSAYAGSPVERLWPATIVRRQRTPSLLDRGPAR